jgi:ABC-type multidrug transport system ATPase subunit
MSAPAVDIRNVSKRFGTNTVLEHVTLTIPSGAARGLVGRNGAGKSTLVGILTGLLSPSGGEVLFEAVESAMARSSCLRLSAVDAGADHVDCREPIRQCLSR